ncbi:MAG: 3'-5' exonuclease, partial [Methanomassiliicoccaceae archaeon]|nr:3'-5' exonuclease [Methanomassiliicoccaceae archaeon]
MTVRDHSDMCSFGYAVADENFEIVEVKEIKIRPKRITKHLEEMLGVTMKDLEEAPVFRDVHSEITEFLEHPDQMIFAHSAISDLVFLGRECRKNSLRMPKIDVYDTHAIFSGYTGSERKALTDTKEWSGAEFENHKASEDARACLFVPKKIFETEGKKDFLKVMEGYADT